jgi:hypothetical protein
MTDEQKLNAKLDGVAKSLDRLEKELKAVSKKEAKDHSEELKAISSEIKALERLSAENANNLPEIDLSGLESKYDALSEDIKSLKESVRYMKWLFPDLAQVIRSGSHWVFYTGLVVIPLAFFAVWHFYSKAETHEESATKYHFYKLSSYSMPEIDSLYKLYPERINFVVDSTQEARAKRAEIEAKKKQLEEEEKKLSGE